MQIPKFGLKVLLLFVASCAILFGALKIWWDTRPINQHLAALERGGKNEALDAKSRLSEMGPVAVPALIRELRTGPPGGRAGAADVLRRIGPDASQAIPALIEALADVNPLVRVSAAEALPEVDPLGARALSALIAALGQPDETVDCAFLRTIGRYGPDATRVAQTVIAKLVKNAGGDVRIEAAKTLHKVCPGDPLVISALIEEIKTGSPQHRTLAAGAIGELGSAAQDALPTLLEVLSDRLSDEELRTTAARSMSQIGPDRRQRTPSRR